LFGGGVGGQIRLTGGFPGPRLAAARLRRRPLVLRCRAPAGAVVSALGVSEGGWGVSAGVAARGRRLCGGNVQLGGGAETRSTLCPLCGAKCGSVSTRSARPANVRS